jgi:hypothetical protein
VYTRVVERHHLTKMVRQNPRITTMPAPMPGRVPKPIEPLCPLRNVVIKADEIVLPTAIRLTFSQTTGANSNKFEAFLDLSTAKIFIKDGEFDYFNSGTLFDCSVAYTRQIKIQKANFFAFREASRLVFTSLTAWACHCRYHMLMSNYVQAAAKDAKETLVSPITRPELVEELKRVPMQKKRGPKTASEAETAAEAAEVRMYGELPIPTHLEQKTLVTVRGLPFKWGRKSGKDAQIRVHVGTLEGELPCGENGISMTEFDALLIKTANKAEVPIYDRKGTPQLFPPETSSRTSNYRVINGEADDDNSNDEQEDSEATAPGASASTSTIVQVPADDNHQSTTTIGYAAPAKRSRKRATPEITPIVKRKRANDPETQAKEAQEANAISDKLINKMFEDTDYGDVVLGVGKGSYSLAATTAPPLPTPSSSSFPSFLAKLRPEIKIVAPSSPVHGDKSPPCAAVDMQRATFDGHKIAVPLPLIDDVVAATITRGIVNNEWLSEELRTLIERQPHLCNAARAGFRRREDQVLLIACNYKSEDIERLLCAVRGTAAENRAVVDGVARGWAQLTTTGMLPATLCYTRNTVPANDPLRFDAGAPNMRRIGQRIHLPNGRTLTQWGVQCTAPINAGELIGTYRGRIVAGGLVELSAEQTVYERAGFKTSEAEDAYSLTVVLADNTKRVISARGADYFGCLMAFINCCGPNNAVQANCEWERGSERVVAKRTLAAGEMLCIDYGNDYYKKMAEQHIIIGRPGEADESIEMLRYQPAPELMSEDIAKQLFARYEVGNDAIDSLFATADDSSSDLGLGHYGGLFGGVDESHVRLSASMPALSRPVDTQLDDAVASAGDIAQFFDSLSAPGSPSIFDVSTLENAVSQAGSPAQFFDFQDVHVDSLLPEYPSPWDINGVYIGNDAPLSL